MFPRQLLRNVVALGHVTPNDEFQPLGSGLVLSLHGIAWLLVPRALVESGNSTGPEPVLPAHQPDVVVLFPDDEAQRFSILRITDFVRILGFGWTTGPDTNPFAVFPLPPSRTSSNNALPERTWRESQRIELGMRCWSIQSASSVPGDFGTLVLDGIICAVQNPPGRNALTTIPSLPGSLGTPILVEPRWNNSAEEDSWHISGCVVHRVRVPGGRRRPFPGRMEAIEHFGVVEPIEEHATSLIGLALARLADVLADAEAPKL